MSVSRPQRQKRQSAGEIFRAAAHWPLAPLGEITVECSEKGLREMRVRVRRAPARMQNRSNLATGDSGPSSNGRNGRPTALARQALAEIAEYLDGSRRAFTVPLDLEGTPFQLKVWKALLKIPYGETRSYGEIARTVGRPRAARAVGMANHTNPVAIIIPCHRVIARDGSLGGYAGGLEMKSWLLRLETAGMGRGGDSSRG